jgi:hypothetical protein
VVSGGSRSVGGRGHTLSPLDRVVFGASCGAWSCSPKELPAGLSCTADSADPVCFGVGACAYVVFGAGLEKGLEAGATFDLLVCDADFVGAATASFGVSATVGYVLVFIVKQASPTILHSPGGS